MCDLDFGALGLQWPRIYRGLRSHWLGFEGKCKPLGYEKRAL